jgi:hypothetical protein
MQAQPIASQTEITTILDMLRAIQQQQMSMQADFALIRQRQEASDSKMAKLDDQLQRLEDRLNGESEFYDREDEMDAHYDAQNTTNTNG